MGKTNIQWCDWTFNAWLGCRKVAPECVNCYITSTPPFRFRGITHGAQRVRTAPSTWKQPLAWNRKAERELQERERTIAAGSLNGVVITYPKMVRPRVFCLSLGDWLDDENVPIEWLADLLCLIDHTPNLDWLLLTKRPQNWERRLEDVASGYFGLETFGGLQHTGSGVAQNWLKARNEQFDGLKTGHTPKNVWIGVSAGADQAAALDIPARIHLLSCEPMLHAMDETHAARFSWIIFGGESGTKARECHTDWIRDGLNFCRANGVAPFIKQLGSNCYAAGRDQKYLIALKDSHGGDMDEWPEDLRVREFPVASEGAV